ncbi:MAG: bifunctional diaminohydroxyphosphoribosylaminopyrimidine deaminase/5-amino-6-(5-phosphoribosylamino)uracil reductase RibD [Oscillospiraceae bacterium]|nr:bifunctional diaminohydroxyphosphoribosylaminopyrimidine deaminase/5-amino-6-(5-phosphoribosylamino)uracil reductase RibD [Oscillospiraceae bacterium]
MTDEEYMLRAVQLARNGIGFVNPNPLVGAVIVKNGNIIGEGWHEQYGQPHAERNALKNCTESPEGAEIYVTLEPCCHHGKQPPCTEAIIQAGIRKVYIGSDDPNPLVAGKGAELLRQAGIEVQTGVCQAECDKLNKIFFHYITTKTPYCMMKIAMTADGKTATRTGLSRWITNEASRRHVHETRKQFSGIMCGIGTVIADNPSLTCRIENPSNPTRIICDTHLRIPVECNIVRTADQVPTIVATSSQDEAKLEKLRNHGVQILKIKAHEGNINLKLLMKKLGEQGIDSVLLEGGACLHESALRAGIVQHVQIYIAPKIFGGVSAKTAVGGLGVEEVDEAYRLSTPEIRTFGSDILLDYDILEG